MKKKQLKELSKYLNEVNPSTLAASITFYLLFIIIPIMVLLSNIFKFLQIDFLPDYQFSNTKNIISLISLVISIIWVSSKFINELHISSDVIYQEEKRRPRISRKIRSIILMVILLIIITAQIAFVIYFLYFFKNILQINEYYVMLILQFLLQFISISLILGFLYKVVVPIKIKFKQTFFISLLITLIWYILTIVYYYVNYILKLNNYDVLYGTTSSLMLFIFWLYLIVLSFVYVVCLHYYFTKKRYEINK